EAAHGGQLPPDRRRSELARPRLAELRRVVGEDADVHVVQANASLREPVSELAHVDRVGLSRRFRKRRTGEKAVDCRGSVHGASFAAATTIACPWPTESSTWQLSSSSSARTSNPGSS